ncbi:unnamed protein product, partial [marine sediment metagenome]
MSDHAGAQLKMWLAESGQSDHQVAFFNLRCCYNGGKKSSLAQLEECWDVHTKLSLSNLLGRMCSGTQPEELSPPLVAVPHVVAVGIPAYQFLLGQKPDGKGQDRYLGTHT